MLRTPDSIQCSGILKTVKKIESRPLVVEYAGVSSLTYILHEHLLYQCSYNLLLSLRDSDGRPMATPFICRACRARLSHTRDSLRGQTQDRFLSIAAPNTTHSGTAYLTTNSSGIRYYKIRIPQYTGYLRTKAGEWLQTRKPGHFRKRVEVVYFSTSSDPAIVRDDGIGAPGTAAGSSSSQISESSAKTEEETTKNGPSNILRPSPSPKERRSYYSARQKFKMLPGLRQSSIVRHEERNIDWQQVQKDIKKDWNTLSIKDRRSNFWEYMTSSLRSPILGLNFLAATFDTRVLSSFTVERAVHLLVLRMLTMRTTEAASFARELVGLILVMLQDSQPGQLRFRQMTLVRLAKLADEQSLQKFYKALMQYGHFIHQQTLVHLARRLVDSRATQETAVDILQSIMRSDVALHRNGLDSLCTATIRQTTSSPALRLRALEVILGDKEGPNYITADAIIRSLMETGDYDQAWTVFDGMVDRDMEFDGRLISRMLNGEKSRFDAGNLAKLTRILESRNLWDSYVVNDILHIIFLSACHDASLRALAPEQTLPAFGPMLQVYTRFFDLSVLEKFVPIQGDHGLGTSLDEAIPPVGWATLQRVSSVFASLVDSPAAASTSSSSSPPARLEPKPSTILLMLTAYVRASDSPSEVVAVAARLREMLLKGDPLGTSLAMGHHGHETAVYDRVLRELFLQGRRRVANAPVVAMSLLARMAADAASPDPQTKNCPAPSPHTLAIVVEGLMANGLPDYAERVVSLLDSGRGAGGEARDASVAASEEPISKLNNGRPNARTPEQRDKKQSSTAKRSTIAVTPNVVTWNSLIKGHARRQQPLATARVLLRMDRRGFAPDDDTAAAFRRLDYTRQASALEMLERLRRETPEGEDEAAIYVADGRPLSPSGSKIKGGRLAKRAVTRKSVGSMLQSRDRITAEKVASLQELADVMTREVQQASSRQ